MKRILVLFCLLLLVACEQRQSPTVSFYYWKTNFQLTPLEKKTLQDNKVTKIYLRYFDVALTQNQAFPVSPVAINQKLENISITPVVFIKNEVFLSNKIDIQALSKNIFHLIEQINKKHQINCSEIQIDCDWSLASQEKYFKFINAFKQESKRKVSATIRLHQVKYKEKTKIPAVDSGVLMLYNMGKIAPDDKNSIYDKAIANQYLKSLKSYPLKINVALPIFSWAIQIRNNHVINLISKTNNSNFTSDAHFKKTKDNFFVVVTDVLKMGLYFKKGDAIKIETITQDNLSEMINLLSENMKNVPEEIIYYDLDEFNIQQYHDESFFTKCNSQF